jgi:hypothetical protein
VLQAGSGSFRIIVSGIRFSPVLKGVSHAEKANKGAHEIKGIANEESQKAYSQK